VGRLDADTSGLLLVTNDGDLAHKLMHPRYGVEKRYKVLVSEVPDSSQLTRLRSGVTLEPGVRTGPRMSDSLDRSVTVRRSTFGSTKAVTGKCGACAKSWDSA
jgi:pseudouridine synthase